jgi:hypothetical protein
MKSGLRITSILILVLLLHSVYSQTFDMETKVEARLESLLILNIDPEAKIEFGIKEINDNLYQITKKPGDVNFTIESTGNWNLSISATEPYFHGVNDTSQKIPVDFIGYSIENKGDNWDNGLFSNIANKSKDTILPLSFEETLILINGRKNNIGNSENNSFVIRWKFIYEDEISKMKKFSAFKIKDDYYIGGFYVTLSESTIPYK